VVGVADVAYVARETPMTVYSNVHFALEPLRDAAAAASPGRRGPRVMVVGGAEVGKSWLCRTLANYAARVGRKPLLVDLDVNRGGVAVPGAMGVVCLQHPRPLYESLASLAPYVRSRLCPCP
jgi:polyribonucleotide 5'-hydroxyl-kinase